MFFAVVIAALALMPVAVSSAWAAPVCPGGQHFSIVTNSCNDNSGQTNITQNANPTITQNANPTQINTQVNSQENRQTTIQGQHQGQGQQQGQGQGQGQSLKNKINVENTIEGDNTKVYAPAPSVFAPALTSGNDVCVGSISTALTGGNGIVGAGLSFGKTFTDDNCIRLKNANALNVLGYKEAALALLAQDKNVAAALKKTGHKAAWLNEPTPVKQVKASAQKEIVVSTDPSRSSVMDHTKDPYESVRPDFLKSMERQ
jgi:hypothetical protein